VSGAAEPGRAADVVIAGGGVMGSAVAYFLTADPAFDGTVAVVERDPSYAACATARSWGGVRQQFSTPENVRLSLASLAFFREAETLLAVDGAGPDLAFREAGYLFLASPAGLPVLQANHRLQCALGAEIALLAPDELAERFPWLSLDGVAAGGLGLSGEGWLDPNALLHGFRRKARAQGARFLHDEVSGVARDGAAIRSVALAGGATIACGHLVNAAGPWAGRLAALAGIALPVGPRKRMSYVFDCRAELPGMPLVVDPSGLAFRPEGRQFMAILSPPPEDDPETEDLSEDLADDHRPFERAIWPILAARVPAFEAIKATGAWAGLYDHNSLDRNAVIGRHPEIANFHFCAGFSGHGLQQAPAAGRAVAETIVHGRFLSLDVNALGYRRILEDTPLAEVNVV